MPTTTTTQTGADPAARFYTLSCRLCGDMELPAETLMRALRCPKCRGEWPHAFSLRGPGAPAPPRAKPAKPEQTDMAWDAPDAA